MRPIFQSWLVQLLRPLPGVDGALVMLGPVHAPEVVANWPGKTAEADLEECAESALTQDKPEVRSLKRESDPAAERCLIATPFKLGPEDVGSVAVRVAPSAIPPSEIVRLLQQGSGWLRLLVASARQGDEAPATLLDLLGGVFDAPTLGDASRSVADALCRAARAERVAIARLDGRTVRIAGVSATPHLEARSKLARLLGAAAEECIDQRAVVSSPRIDGDSQELDRAHVRLRESSETAAVLSVPLSSGGEVVGALLLSFADPGSLTADRVDFARRVGATLGPALELKARPRGRPIGRALDRLRAQLRALRGPGQMRLKLAYAAAGVALGLGLVLPFPYRVSAPAHLEGIVQRAVVAGIDGYVAESRARAGDHVRAGDLLGALDDADLELERRRAAARRSQLAKELRAALASHDRSQGSIARARLDQVDAELLLLDTQIERTRLTAPFDGIVARGDLSHALGSPVKRGDVLFEVAPVDRYRVVLEVDERAVANVANEQPGRLTLSALPAHEHVLHVERIAPVATAEGGRNFFRVEARLEAPDPRLRPGMEGVGKIEAGERSLLWIATHSLVDWIRLQLWRWLP